MDINTYGNIKSFNKVYGSVGERLACEYLEEQGYKIVEKNYKNFFGEIDIICTKNEGQEIKYIFVEVKYRNSKKFGLPREAVTKSKQLNIKKVATSYLKFKGLFDKVFVRFDCVEILCGVSLEDSKIEHIENAF